MIRVCGALLILLHITKILQYWYSTHLVDTEVLPDLLENLGRVVLKLERLSKLVRRSHQVAGSPRWRKGILVHLHSKRSRPTTEREEGGGTAVLTTTHNPKVTTIFGHVLTVQ